MEWVSVKERMPNEKGFYLVGKINEYGRTIYFQRYWSSGQWWEQEGTTDSLTKLGMCTDEDAITHWMEIPEIDGKICFYERIEINNVSNEL
jgi:hypothetical protein